MEEANRLFPVVRRADDFVDKSSGSVEEREEFPEDFGTYWHRELNWSRLVAKGGDSRVSAWVFWNRQDDRPNTLPISDLVSENVDVSTNSCPKVKDKIRLALGRIMLHPRYGQSLVQFWAPSRTLEGRTLLTTQNQPFGLGKAGRSAWGLCEYRMKSLDYKFYGDIGVSGGEELGLPGRVFLYKLPESAPDVQYYSLNEYPQSHDASLCQVRASWALPVFEHSSQVCVGVLELVSTVDAIEDWYDKSFLRNMYNVFQELGLQSSDVHKHYEIKYKDGDEALTTAFHELTLLLESVYEIHKLPLALTWVPCNACDALLPGLSSNGEEYLQSFMANDNHLVESLIASTGYHLRKGYVAEMVLGSTSMLYCSDVTQFSIAEYPLVPFARQFKLSGCFTVCLHSSYTGEYVYMLEFFLPTSSKDNENTLTQVSTILGTMKEYSETFKLASGQELGEVLSVTICDFQNGQRHQYSQMIEGSLELLQNGDNGMDIINAEQDDTVATISKGGTTKSQERELKKTGVRFDIPLEDVLRFSALSRKNAAMKLQVSQSTLKRVCRKYGIHRWPPPDLNKEETFSSALPNVGDTVNLDSPKELERDATLNGPHDDHWTDWRFNSPERCNSDATCSEEGTITMQKRKRGKTGIRVEIPLDDVLKFSKMKHSEAARELKVGLSVLKRICRGYGIPRWPPRMIDKVGAPQPSRDVPLRNIDKVGAPQPSCDVPTCNIDKVGTPQPSHVVLQEGISQLTSDMPSNQASNGRDYCIHQGPPQNINKFGAAMPSHVEHEEGISQLTSSSVVHIQPHNAASREMEMVTIKAKYSDSDHIIRFCLSMSSGMQELQQEVSMRLKQLNLEAGNYCLKYKDEEGDHISIACDDDLHDYIHTCRSLGNTRVLIVIVPYSK